jgi:hypothetical protein
MEVCYQLQALAVLPAIPTEWDAGRAPVRTGHSGVDKSLLHLLGVEPRAIQSVTILIELPRNHICNLSYEISSIVHHAIN